MGEREAKKFQLSPEAIKDIAFPVSINKPIEGFPRELRYKIRLWRVRLGQLMHLAAGIGFCAGYSEYDYPLDQSMLLSGIVNLSAFTLGAIITTGRPLKYRRFKRMYLPFIDKNQKLQ